MTDTERYFEASLMATEAAHRILPPVKGSRLSEWELHEEPDGGFHSEQWLERGRGMSRELLANVDVWLDSDLDPVLVKATWQEFDPDVPAHWADGKRCH